MLKSGFLDDHARANCLRVTKDRREEHRFSRRANALLLLDDRISYEQVAKALYLDDSTVRAWRDPYEVGSVESTYASDAKRGTGLPSKAQIDELHARGDQGSARND